MLQKLKLNTIAFSAGLFGVYANAASLSDVVEVYRENRYALKNASFSYESADPADRRVIQAYYSELEAASLLSPIVSALEAASQKSASLMSAIEQAIEASDPVSSQIRSCMSLGDASARQNMLTRSARSARAQLEASYAGSIRSPSSSGTEFDLENTVTSYNILTDQNWTQKYLQCCKEKSLDMLQRVGSTSVDNVEIAALKTSNQRNASKVSALSEDGGCDRLAEPIARAQTDFYNHEYALPSRVQDPLEGMKMSAEEIAKVLKSSSVRASLRDIRERSHTPTDAMFKEHLYFLEIDDSCTAAKNKIHDRENSLTNTLIKTGLNATFCHILPMVATENWSTKAAQATYLAADLTMALPWRDLRCDPNETQAYRSQRPTTRNAVADKWGIPQIQNSAYLNSLRSMVPLTANPIVRSPDGSFILPGGVLGGPAPTRAEIEAQYLGQNGISVGAASTGLSTTARLSGMMPNSGAGSRLAFVAGPSGSTRYVRSAAGRSLATRSSPAINGVRALAGNIETSSPTAPQSAAALKQAAAKGRTLASSLVGEHQKRGLAAMSQKRQASADNTRGLVQRSVVSKSSRVSAEWVAKVLRDRRAPASTGNQPSTNVVIGSGNRPKSTNTPSQQDKIVDELYKANERRRQNLIAQADAMTKSIQDAVKRSAEIVKEIQDKITSRDLVFNKTVEKMVSRPPDSQYSMVKDLIVQDGRRLKEIGVLKAEYDALAASIPMLTSSLNRLGSFSPQVQSTVGTAFGTSNFSSLPAPGTDGRFNSGSSTSVFAPASNVPAPSPTIQSQEVSQLKSVLDSWSLKIFVPEAFANLDQKPGTLAYEKRWSEAYTRFQNDWNVYLEKLREVEQSDRQSLVKRYRQLSKPPEQQELFEPDAETFALMWDTMEVITEESKSLLQNQKAEAKGKINKVKIYQDVEMAQNESEKALALLAEWASSYSKSAPKSYYDDPQVWESMIPDAILY